MATKSEMTEMPSAERTVVTAGINTELLSNVPLLAHVTAQGEEADGNL